MAPTIHELLGRASESCPGGQCDNTPSSEKAYIAAGSSVCGAIVLTVGGILLYRRLRDRSKEKTSRAANANDSMATPMMSNYAPSTFSFQSQAHGHLTSQPQNTYQPPARPPVSPAMSTSSYYNSDTGSGGGSGSSSASDHSIKSPMSDHSSQFAFPILSADGHLMPPVPASSRKSWNISEGDLGSGAAFGRPLPLAPAGGAGAGDEVGYDYTYDQDQEIADDYSQYTYERSSEDHAHSLKAPVPHNPTKRWSYEPPTTSSDPEVVGLYPNSIDLRRDDYEYGYGHGYDSASIRSNQRTPKVQDLYGFHQPQSATYHSSFSAEGEDLRA